MGQVHRDRIELFLDGQLSASLSIRPEHSDVPCQLVLGRLTALPGSGLSVDRPFVGRIDEVALYDRRSPSRRSATIIGSGPAAPRPR